jgi:hypothetical protein
MKPEALLIVVFLALSPLLLLLQHAHSDVPYFGILRGWENGSVNQIIGYDIAVDDSGIYIAGEFFKDVGYGPTVLFLNPDHTFRCQKVLQFNVDARSGVPRSGAYSIALTDNSVIVAGVYGEWPGLWHVARLFVAVFNKEDCRLTGIKELIDKSLGDKWLNLYPFFVSGVKVVWDQARSSMFVMLQTLEVTSIVPHLYIIQLDTELRIRDAVRYDLFSSDNFYVSDMFDGGSVLYVTGAYIDKDREPHILYGEIKKDPLGASWYYFPLSFPEYDVRIGGFLPLSRIVLTSVGGQTYVNIAYTMKCSGRDCAVGISEAFRLGILRFPLNDPSSVEVRLYNFTTTHWNTPAPYNHYNNTWVTQVAEAGGVLYIVGFLNMDPNWLIYDEGSRSYSLAEDLDGFVYAVDARTLNPQYMFRVVSLDGAPSSGGSRVPSAVLGAGSYNGYAYITGTAGNYYLEFTPFNPSNITGTATRNGFPLTTKYDIVFEEYRNFQFDYDNNPIFDQDAHPSTAGFYGVLRLKSATTTTSTTTSTVTETTTSTITSTVVFPITTTATATRTVTSTPTVTVTQFTTSTRTTATTVVTTMQIFSTIYTTRIVENTTTRVETVTFVTTIPYVTTLTGTTTILRVVTATKTPTVYLNQTVRLTTTIEVQQEAIIPWTYLILPFMLLLPFPPLLIMKGRRLTITILEGAGAQTSVTQQTSILNEYLKPTVGSIKRGGKVIFRNKDRVIHTVELFIPGVPDKHWVFVLKPGEKAGIKMKEPGKYFIILERVPRKVGILEVGQ